MEKTMLVSELLALMENDISEWSFSSYTEVSEEETLFCIEYNEEGNAYEVPIYSVYGYGHIEAKHISGVCVSYSESFQLNKYDEESFCTGFDDNGNGEELSAVNVTLLDEDGQVFVPQNSPNWPRNCFPCEFRNIDYSSVEDTYINVEIQVDQGVVMNEETQEKNVKNYKLHVDNEPNLVFTGKLIADVESDEVGGRWFILRLYKTIGGNYVCRKIGKTKWVNESTRLSAKVCSTEAEVIEFFGFSDEAKEIYDDANINANSRVE